MMYSNGTAAENVYNDEEDQDDLLRAEEQFAEDMQAGLSDDAPWKRIQQNTFTRWANEHLKVVNRQINDLQYDLSDGLLLIALIEILSQKKLPKHNKKTTFRSQKLENVSVALDFLENVEQIKLVNIDASHIVDGRLKLILGLIWTLILHYYISLPRWESMPVEEQKPGREPTPKQKLMGWVKNMLPPDLPITNFTTDWNDGRAIGALVDACAPGLYPDWVDNDPRDALKNTREAMDLAKDWLGIPQLIRPEEMIDPNVDDRSMMTYLSQYPSAKLKPGAPLRPKTNAALARCYGKGIEPAGNFAGEPTEFFVETKQAGVGKLNVILLNPRGQQERCDIAFQNDPDRTYKCTYTPSMEGQYKVIVKYANQEVPGSPFSPFMDRRPANANACRAYGPGLESEVTVDKPTWFEIDHSEAGKGKVDGVILDRNHQEVPVVVKPVEAGKSRGEYVPRTQGPHEINLLYDGQPIPGSPFVTEAVPDPNACRAFGRGVEPNGVSAGEKADFKIVTTDKGDGVVRVAVVGPDGYEVPCSLVRTSPQSYDCSYVPKKAGPHHVNVTYDGKHIPQSPFNVMVPPSRAPDVRAYGPGLKGGVVNEPADFFVETTGNPEDLSFSVEGPDKVQLTCDNRGDGSVAVRYLPISPGQHTVHVLNNNEEIPGSPFNAWIEPKGASYASKVQPVKPGDLSKVRVYGPGVEPGVKVNKPTYFVVDCKDAGPGDVSVALTDPTGKDLPLQIEDLDGGFSVGYTPETPGIHTVTVLFGNDEIPESPIKVNVQPGVDVSRIYPEEFNPTPVVNRPNQIKLNTMQAGPVDVNDVSAKISPSFPTGALPIATEVVPTDTGFGINYQVPKPGAYTITPAVQGMPLKPINVEAQEPVDPNKVRVYGPGLAAGTVNQPSDFTVDMGGAGPGELRVAVEGPAKPKLSREDNNDESCKVTYVPTAPGDHLISVLFDDQHVPGSPFRPVVSPAKDVRKVRAYGPGVDSTTGVSVGCQTEFTVDARPIGPTGGADVTCSLHPVHGAPSRASVADNRDGTYTVTYTPESKGPFDVDVRYDATPVPGSPFRMQAAEPEPGRIRCYGPGLESAVVNVPAQFTIDTTDAGPGHLDVAIDGPGDAPLIMKQKVDGLCVIEYVPSRPGKYEINITFNGKPLPTCPYVVPVADRPSEGQVRVSLPEQPLRVNAPSELLIDGQAAGPGVPSVNVVDPYGISRPVPVRTIGTETGFPRRPSLTGPVPTGGRYVADLTPTTPGVHQVNVDWSGRPVAGSPFNIQAVPSFEPEKVSVSGPGIRPTVPASLPTQFTVDTRAAGPGQLDVLIRTPDNSYLDRAIDDNKDGTYTIHYLPVEPGSYNISVSYDSLPIMNSPFTISVTPTGDPTKCRISGNGILARVPVGKQCIIHVDATEAGPGAVTATIVNQAGVPLDFDIIDTKIGTFDIVYVPPVPGQYTIQIRFGGQDIPDGTFVVTASTEEPFRPDSRQAKLMASMGTKPLDFRLPVGGAIGDVTAVMRTPSGKRTTPLIEDNQDGTVSIKYHPTEVGEHELSVFYQGVPVQGSPYKFTVDRVTDGYVTAYGPGLSYGISGEPCHFKVVTKDAGAGSLAVAVEGPSKAEIRCKDNKDGTCDATYWPTAPGDYVITVKYGGKHIAGSPFHAKIADKRYDGAGASDGLKPGIYHDFPIGVSAHRVPQVQNGHGYPRDRIDTGPSEERYIGRVPTTEYAIGYGPEHGVTVCPPADGRILKRGANGLHGIDDTSDEATQRGTPVRVTHAPTHPEKHRKSREGSYDGALPCQELPVAYEEGVGRPHEAYDGWQYPTRGYTQVKPSPDGRVVGEPEGDETVGPRKPPTDDGDHRREEYDYPLGAEQLPSGISRPGFERAMKDDMSGPHGRPFAGGPHRAADGHYLFSGQPIDVRPRRLQAGETAGPQGRPGMGAVDSEDYDYPLGAARLAGPKPEFDNVPGTVHRDELTQTDDGPFSEPGDYRFSHDYYGDEFASFDDTSRGDSSPYGLQPKDYGTDWSPGYSNVPMEVSHRPDGEDFAESEPFDSRRPSGDSADYSSADSPRVRLDRTWEHPDGYGSDGLYDKPLFSALPDSYETGERPAAEPYGGRPSEMTALRAPKQQANGDNSGNEVEIQNYNPITKLSSAEDVPIDGALSHYVSGADQWPTGQYVDVPPHGATGVLPRGQTLQKAPFEESDQAGSPKGPSDSWQPPAWRPAEQRRHVEKVAEPSPSPGERWSSLDVRAGLPSSVRGSKVARPIEDDKRDGEQGGRPYGSSFQPYPDGKRDVKIPEEGELYVPEDGVSEFPDQRKKEAVRLTGAPSKLHHEGPGPDAQSGLGRGGDERPYKGPPLRDALRDGADALGPGRPGAFAQEPNVPASEGKGSPRRLIHKTDVCRNVSTTDVHEVVDQESTVSIFSVVPQEEGDADVGQAGKRAPEREGIRTSELPKRDELVPQEAIFRPERLPESQRGPCVPLTGDKGDGMPGFYPIGHPEQPEETMPTLKAAGPLGSGRPTSGGYPTQQGREGATFGDRDVSLSKPGRPGEDISDADRAGRYGAGDDIGSKGPSRPLAADKGRSPVSPAESGTHLTETHEDRVSRVTTTDTGIFESIRTEELLPDEEDLTGRVSKLGVPTASPLREDGDRVGPARRPSPLKDQPGGRGFKSKLPVSRLAAGAPSDAAVTSEGVPCPGLHKKHVPDDDTTRAAKKGTPTERQPAEDLTKAPRAMPKAAEGRLPESMIARFGAPVTKTPRDLPLKDGGPGVDVPSGDIPHGPTAEDDALTGKPGLPDDAVRSSEGPLLGAPHEMLPEGDDMSPKISDTPRLGAAVPGRPHDLSPERIGALGPGRSEPDDGRPHVPATDGDVSPGGFRPDHFPDSSIAKGLSKAPQDLSLTGGVAPMSREPQSSDGHAPGPRLADGISPGLSGAGRLPDGTTTFHESPVSKVSDDLPLHDEGSKPGASIFDDARTPVRERDGDFPAEGPKPGLLPDSAISRFGAPVSRRPHDQPTDRDAMRPGVSKFERDRSQFPTAKDETLLGAPRSDHPLGGAEPRFEDASRVSRDLPAEGVPRSRLPTSDKIGPHVPGSDRDAFPKTPRTGSARDDVIDRFTGPVSEVHRVPSSAGDTPRHGIHSPFDGDASRPDVLTFDEGRPYIPGTDSDGFSKPLRPDHLPDSALGSSPSKTPRGMPLEEGTPMPDGYSFGEEGLPVPGASRGFSAGRPGAGRLSESSTSRFDATVSTRSHHLSTEESVLRREVTESGDGTFSVPETSDDVSPWTWRPDQLPVGATPRLEGMPWESRPDLLPDGDQRGPRTSKLHDGRPHAPTQVARTIPGAAGPGHLPEGAVLRFGAPVSRRPHEAPTDEGVSRPDAPKFDHAEPYLPGVGGDVSSVALKPDRLPDGVGASVRGPVCKPPLEGIPDGGGSKPEGFAFHEAGRPIPGGDDDTSSRTQGPGHLPESAISRFGAPVSKLPHDSSVEGDGRMPGASAFDDGGPHIPGTGGDVLPETPRAGQLPEGTISRFGVPVSRRPHDLLPGESSLRPGVSKPGDGGPSGPRAGRDVFLPEHDERHPLEGDSLSSKAPVTDTGESLPERHVPKADVTVPHRPESYVPGTKATKADSRPLDGSSAFGDEELPSHYIPSPGFSGAYPDRAKPGVSVPDKISDDGPGPTKDGAKVPVSVSVSRPELSPQQRGIDDGIYRPGLADGLRPEDHAKKEFIPLSGTPVDGVSGPPLERDYRWLGGDRPSEHRPLEDRLGVPKEDLLSPGAVIASPRDEQFARTGAPSSQAPHLGDGGPGQESMEPKLRKPEGPMPGYRQSIDKSRVFVRNVFEDGQITTEVSTTAVPDERSPGRGGVEADAAAHADGMRPRPFDGVGDLSSTFKPHPGYAEAGPTALSDTEWPYTDGIISEIDVPLSAGIGKPDLADRAGIAVVVGAIPVQPVDQRGVGHVDASKSGPFKLPLTERGERVGKDGKPLSAGPEDGRARGIEGAPDGPSVSDSKPSLQLPVQGSRVHDTKPSDSPHGMHERPSAGDALWPEGRSMSPVVAGHPRWHDTDESKAVRPYKDKSLEEAERYAPTGQDAAGLPKEFQPLFAPPLDRDTKTRIGYPYSDKRIFGTSTHIVTSSNRSVYCENLCDTDKAVWRDVLPEVSRPALDMPRKLDDERPLGDMRDAGSPISKRDFPPAGRPDDRRRQISLSFHLPGLPDYEGDRVAPLHGERKRTGSAEPWQRDRDREASWKGRRPDEQVPFVEDDSTYHGSRSGLSFLKHPAGTGEDRLGARPDTTAPVQSGMHFAGPRTPSDALVPGGAHLPDHKPLPTTSFEHPDSRDGRYPDFARADRRYAPEASPRGGIQPTPHAKDDAYLAAVGRSIFPEDQERQPLTDATPARWDQQAVGRRPRSSTDSFVVDSRTSRRERRIVEDSTVVRSSTSRSESIVNGPISESSVPISGHRHPGDDSIVDGAYSGYPATQVDASQRDLLHADSVGPPSEPSRQARAPGWSEHPRDLAVEQPRPTGLSSGEYSLTQRDRPVVTEEYFPRPEAHVVPHPGGPSYGPSVAYRDVPERSSFATDRRTSGYSTASSSRLEGSPRDSLELAAVMPHDLTDSERRPDLVTLVKRPLGRVKYSCRYETESVVVNSSVSERRITSTSTEDQSTVSRGVPLYQSLPSTDGSWPIRSAGGTVTTTDSRRDAGDADGTEVKPFDRSLALQPDRRLTAPSYSAIGGSIDTRPSGVGGPEHRSSGESLPTADHFLSPRYAHPTVDRRAPESVDLARRDTRSLASEPTEGVTSGVTRHPATGRGGDVPVESASDEKPYSSDGLFPDRDTSVVPRRDGSSSALQTPHFVQDSEESKAGECRSTRLIDTREHVSRVAHESREDLKTTRPDGDRGTPTTSTGLVSRAPFPSEIRRDVADASRVKVYGAGLDEGYINVANEFIVDSRDAGNGPLAIAIEGPSKANIECPNKDDGTCVVSYKVSEPGTYYVSIKFAEAHVPGSPYVVKVHGPGEPFRPTGRMASPARQVQSADYTYRSRVVSDKLSQSVQMQNVSACASRVGSPCELCLRLPGVSPDELTAFVTSPRGLVEDCEVIDVGNQCKSVRFIPKETGIHSVSVKRKGQHIAGSPYQFTVGPIAEGGAQKVHLSGRGLSSGIANVPCEFNVYTREAGSGCLTIQVEGPVNAEINFQEVQDGNGVVSYTCPEPGDYSVAVKFNDQHVPGSPFSVHIEPNLSDTKRITIEDIQMPQGVQHHEVNVPLSFMVTSRHGIGAPAKIEAYVVTPTGKETCIVHQSRDGDKERCTIRFVPRESGLHRVHVICNGRELPDSPFEFMVGGTVSSTKTSSLDSRKVVASGQGLHSGVVGQPCEFFVDTSQAGTGLLAVVVDGPSKVQLNCKESAGGYNVSFVATAPGEYVISIKFAGNTIAGSPYKCHIVGSDSTVKPFTSSSVDNISLIDDRYLSSDLSGAYGVSSYKQPLTSRSISSTHFYSQEVSSHHSGSTQGRYSVGSPGWAIADAGTRPGVDGYSEPQKVRTYGAGTTRARRDEQTEFTVDATEAGHNMLMVGILGPSRPCEEVLVKHMGKNVYNVSYVVHEKGSYVLIVKWGDSHIPGSPFYIEVP